MHKHIQAGKAQGESSHRGGPCPECSARRNRICARIPELSRDPGSVQSLDCVRACAVEKQSRVRSTVVGI